MRSKRLPPELWEHIFSFCDYRELKCNISPVCRAFEDAVRTSSKLATVMFRSKDIPPIVVSTGKNPLDDTAPKLFRVHPALREKIAFTPNMKTLCFYQSEIIYVDIEEKDPKPKFRGKWARNRFRNLGEIYLDECGVFEENATEPPANKMTVIFRPDDKVGGHGFEEYSPPCRGKIDFTGKSGDQAIKVKHILKCISEYEKHSTFNDDTEETVEIRINGKGDEILVGTARSVMFGEEEENDDEEDYSGKTPFDNSDDGFEFYRDPEEEEELKEGEVPEEYLREMDWMYVTFKRQVQNVQVEKASLTLWGRLQR